MFITEKAPVSCWRAKVLCCALLIAIFTGYIVTASAAEVVSVRTVSRNEGLYDVEYPVVYGLGDEGVQELINKDIDRHVQNFYAELEKSNTSGKLRYHVYKKTAEVLSLTLKTMQGPSAKNSDGKTYGLNYDLRTGANIDLGRYYSNESLLNRAQDGLKYVYKLELPKASLKPNTYYIDQDDNIIIIYYAGMITDKASGEIEVNVTAADEAKVEEAPTLLNGNNLPEGIITGSEVRLRNLPGLDAQIMGYLAKDESVRIAEQKSKDGIEWYRIVRTKGGTGWGAAQYCRKVKSEVAKDKISERAVIAGEEVRLRSEPSTNADIINWFVKDEVVRVEARSNAGGQEWCKVTRSNGDSGWVAAQFCRIEG